MHNKESFIELGARQRAKAILDSGSFRGWNRKGSFLNQMTAWSLLREQYRARTPLSLLSKALSRAEAWAKSRAQKWRRPLT